MADRIRFLSHQNQQILLVDCSQCSAREIENIARTVPDYVMVQPRGSVRLLVDFTGASFDQEALRAMKETTVFDKPYIKKSAWIGAEGVPQALRDDLKTFSRREFPAFKTRRDALDWLVEG